MIRLHLVVEGWTEQRFVKQVLAPHLASHGVAATARCVETSRDRYRIYRGGMISYTNIRNDLRRWMKQEPGPDVRFSTMIDLYRLPDGFAEFPVAKKIPDPRQQVMALETAFAADVSDPRFVPYIQLHEFEALVLVDPQRLSAHFPNADKATQRLSQLGQSVETPELIDDKHPPSKRIIEELPEYEGRKAVVGPLIAAEIGIEALRVRCPHFAQWLGRLEALGTAVGRS
ncbi:DUF4276 family protein [Candidatus Fermentibacteria bacterium]|nr:DUF4276 family protein [Candidatus Fermentibacteria bacterium]